MKRILLLTVVFIMMLGTSFSFAQADADNFYKSDWVKVEKVSFSNQYKMKVAGNLFLPKTMKEGEKYPAIIVGHPMGAVKEQSANLYATKMAERGFVTLSIDLSFWGASEGEPRNAVLPEVYAEDFSAAVDFLGTRPFIDRNNIGVIGICGSGSFAISAVKIDPRLKAIATISMYNMGTASRNGLKHALTLEQRKQIMAEAAEQRYAEFLRRHEGQHILFLELGVGGNTPVIIKYPFWRMTYQNPKAVYACVNLSEAYCPREIQRHAICIDKDIGKTIGQISKYTSI